jgi:hypothetical protein
MVNVSSLQGIGVIPFWDDGGVIMKQWAFAAVVAGAMVSMSGAANAVASFSGGAAGPRIETGGFGDLAWQAQSLIVGMTPTAGGTAATFFNGPGNPIFHANPAQYGGVVPIIMNTPDGAFICTASLIGRQTLLTAAHCVSNGAGSITATTTTAFFNENLSPTTRAPFNPSAIDITVRDYFIHPLYTGQVIDHHDIAILRLSADAPDWANIYRMDLDIPGLRGVDFNVAGFGARSTVGGCGTVFLGQCLNGGATAGSTGFLRQGDNMFDFRFGDPIFGTNWEPVVGPRARAAIKDL